MSTYPPYSVSIANARICSVEPCSAFDDAGFVPGCIVHSVDGQPLRDVIDWRWLSGSEDEIIVAYTDTDGDTGEVLVERESGQPWGIEFDALLFDEVKTCRNACTFCFMRQLPPSMRASLYLRDDDFRLSFLTGTFVTLTNLSDEDETRIIEQNLSPLRFSLHSIDPDVRKRLIGKHAPHGLEVFSRLSQAGIKFDVQIVLVPGENDGSFLEETLFWASQQESIDAVGIVPLGYTRFQSEFSESYSVPSSALSVLNAVERAQTLRSVPWVYAADEFYLNAYGKMAIDRIPPSEQYGDFAMFEDGVGMARTYIDDWEAAQNEGLVDRAVGMLSARGIRAHLVYGEAMRPLIEGLWSNAGLLGRLSALYVSNRYFGGNVTVTGLLTATDIIPALKATHPEDICLVPCVVFNDMGVTLDDQSAVQLSESAGRFVYVVSCNPTLFLEELITILAN